MDGVGRVEMRKKEREGGLLFEDTLGWLVVNLGEIRHRFVSIVRPTVD